MKGASEGSTIFRNLRQPLRPKLAAISRSSSSRPCNPSRMLTRVKGRSTAVTAKITVRSLSPNHSTAKRVQPIPEKELRNGVRRP
jgi:hypothetical protein